MSESDRSLELLLIRYRTAYDKWQQASSRDMRGLLAWMTVREDYSHDVAYPLVMHDFRDAAAEDIYRRIVLLMRARRKRAMAAA